jgi:Zyg-11 family protein
VFFSQLLDSTSDGIEVSYNACGVLSHMCFDGQVAWTIHNPTRDSVMTQMRAAIKRWPITSKRNINYR